MIKSPEKASDATLSKTGPLKKHSGIKKGEKYVSEGVVPFLTARLVVKPDNWLHSDAARLWLVVADVRARPRPVARLVKEGLIPMGPKRKGQEIGENGEKHG